MASKTETERLQADATLVHEALNNLRLYRLRLHENQEAFWSRFGVTQSGGSRYETECEANPNGRGMPPSLAILMSLYVCGFVSDDDLTEMQQHIAPFFGGDAADLVRPGLRGAARQRAQDRMQAQLAALSNEADKPAQKSPRKPSVKKRS